MAGVAAADLVGACGGGGAGGDAVGPAGFEVDLPGQPVAAVGVAEGLAEVGAGPGTTGAPRRRGWQR